MLFLGPSELQRAHELILQHRPGNGAFCYVPLDIAMDIARCHVQPGVGGNGWFGCSLYRHVPK